MDIFILMVKKVIYLNFIKKSIIGIRQFLSLKNILKINKIFSNHK